MSTAQEVKQRVTEKMDHAIEHLKRDLAGIRTGRASVALLDGIKVDYYGTLTPLKQVANVATPALYDRGLKYTWGTPFPVVPNWSTRYFDMLTKVSPKPQSISSVVAPQITQEKICGLTDPRKISRM